MGDSRVYPESVFSSQRGAAGTIAEIRVENFMCHSSLQMEFGEWVNFITGQNGSGKSAILTALCVAFGCRAKGTQRAATLKDFIKIGSSYAMVQVKLKNEGEDAFKPETYGQSVLVERRITGSSSTIVLKDHQGKRVSSRRQELHELIDHYNIDVENPCVIMSQDKSREFLHSGNDKDRFKFFFKATLLQQVNDLLQSINEQLKKADDMLLELEASLRPIERQLNELNGKIKNMEHVEEIAQQGEQLKKKLAWSWVYDVDRQLQEQVAKIEQLKGRRVPQCQAKIEHTISKLESLKDYFKHKKSQAEAMFDKTSEVKRRKHELQQALSEAMKKKATQENDCNLETKKFESMLDRVKSLEQQVHDIHQQLVKDTQAEEFEIEERLKELQHDIDDANLTISRLKEEEKDLEEKRRKAVNEIKMIDDEIADYVKKYRDTKSFIRDLQQHQTNKVTAFGGDKVINLLRAIERHHQRFNSPPIGPIGAHVTLVNGDTWDTAVEGAIGRLLNAFIVTSHKDLLLLRACAREAGYNQLQIFIYDFSRPRLNVPNYMLPQTNHPTVLSVIHSDNPTVINVLVDMGCVERQVLVRDYDTGKAVTFDRKIPNLKEVYTSDGHKMYFRGGVQTILPPYKKMRTGRLCSSYDEKIRNLERDASNLQEAAQQCEQRKRDSKKSLNEIENHLQDVQRSCSAVGRELMSKNLRYRDVNNSYVPEASASSASTVDDLHQEIAKIKEEIKKEEILLETLRDSRNKAEAEVRELRMSFESLCESVSEEVGACERAEKELLEIDKNIHDLEGEKAYYENVMENQVLSVIKAAEAHYLELEMLRKDNCEKASIICSESEIKALGDWDGSTPEQLSNQLNKLKQRLKQENQRYPESIDDLRMLYKKKERKIYRKQQTYRDLREKLNVCQTAIDLRWKKFKRNATYLKRQLTWQFNWHLGKKGISGHTNLSYDERTLSIEVKMPQDASSDAVRDTRGLSGGERSFSTLCFALALHGMTESPFRAMDEFDVFMDAVSRKISLDALVNFALEQGSQWIFITPHDISSVQPGPRIKKLQMSAPRP